MNRRTLFTSTGRAARTAGALGWSAASDATRAVKARRSGAPTPPAATPAPAAAHQGLADLPPDVAGTLEYQTAAPASLRNLRVPPEVAAALRTLWDGVVADAYDEFRTLAKERTVSRRMAQRVVERSVVRIEEAQRAMVLAGTIDPLPWDSVRQHVTAASVGVGGATLAAEVATYGSFAVGASVGAATVIVSEAFETYVASSARTHQYRKVGRTADVDLVATDLAAALGDRTALSLPAEGQVARDAAAWLAKKLVEKTAKRLLRALVPGVGVVWNATSAGKTVLKVTRLPLRTAALGEGAAPPRTSLTKGPP
jgi:hypothetical protein